MGMKVMAGRLQLRLHGFEVGNAGKGIVERGHENIQS